MKRLTLLVGLILLLTVSLSYAQEISVDSVTGTWDDLGTTKIHPNTAVTFNIRYNNNTSHTVGFISNGFKVYGPSSFTPVTGQILLPVNTFLPIERIFYFSADGSGVDTIGFSTGLSLEGMQPSYNEIGLKINTGGVAEGETLCLDSSFFPPSGIWKWSSSTANIVPSWDGPHCFLAESLCYFPVIDNCPDTISILNCFYSYQFAAHNELYEDGTIRYAVVEGPGVFNEVSGLWSYNPTELDFGTTQTLTVKA